MEPGPGAQPLLDLVERHYALLFRYALRLTGSPADAEDLTQQTFLSAQTKLGQLRDPENGRAWLCAILRNVYLKKLRERGPQVIHSLDNVPEPAAGTAYDPPWEQEQLQLVLNELPEEYRSPIILFYFGDFSYKDIAEQMGVPIGTVMSRLARAKAYLRKRLAPCSTSL